MCRIVVVLILSQFLCCAKCANILCFFPGASHSHQIFFQPIWRELSLRGHNVTVFTPSPLRDPSLTNLTEIDLSDLFKLSAQGQVKNVMSVSSSPFNSIYSIFETLVMPLNDACLSHPQVKQLLSDKRTKYDVVLVEPFPLTFLALGNLFDCPVIQVYSLNPYSFVYESMGNPVHPVYYPDSTMTYIGDINFFERLYNTVETLKSTLYIEYSVKEKCNDYVRKYFGPNLPHLREISRNTSALFINFNPVLNIVRPLVPTTIPLTFLHIRPPKRLDKDVKRFLDEAHNGAIYMSLGSNVRSAFLNKNLINVIKDSFAELSDYKILWKFEDDSLQNVTTNIMLRKWFEQQDVLAHSNVKLFISQGGVQSTEEAIYYRVPLIVLPFIGDQVYNAKRIENLGIGLYLNPSSLSKNEFKNSILQILQNSSYQKNMDKVSQLSLDDSMTGLEKAIWWTEYIIKNKGTSHLRSPYLDKPLYQYLMLDIIIFLLIILLVFYIILRLLNFYQKLIFLSVIVLFLSYYLNLYFLVFI